jgi:secreted trypsin-like serine protease
MNITCRFFVFCLLLFLVACSGGDDTNPSLTLAGLNDGDTVTLTSTTLNLKGSVSDDGGVRGLVYSLNGGEAVDVTEKMTGGDFDFDVDLGDNCTITLTITVTDNAGNSTSLTITINLPCAPKVELTSPVADAEVLSSPLTVEGKASDDEGVTRLTYSLNGSEGVEVSDTLEGDTFSFEIDLQDEGKNTLEVTATDTEGNSSSASVTFYYLAAPAILGTVYDDADGNGEQNEGEAGLEGWTVYLDKNDNGKLDETEPSTRTDLQGDYIFSSLTSGPYKVRQVMPFGWRNVSGSEEESRPRLKNVQGGRPSVAGPKIVGGSNATIADYPFMVAIGFVDPRSGRFFQFCGGSLIADTWVLTAAHCSVDEEGNPASPEGLAVLVGTDKLSGTEGYIGGVSRVLIHPKYRNETSLGYDFALWELAKPIVLEGKYHTVEMLTAGQETLTADGTLATATGWGALSSGGSSPNNLKVVHLPIVNAQQCLEANKNSFDIENFDTQICAGVPEGGIDTCQGDSGGPLLVRNREGDRWLHAGATSYGVGCAFPRFPGIYARTSVLSGWALKAATLESRGYSLSLKTDTVARGTNFGNKATTRPFTGDIEPRWQVTNLTPVPGVPEADEAVTFRWNILDEGTSAFTCSFNSGHPEVAKTVACMEGSNRVTVEGGYPEGVYLPKLTVRKENLLQERERVLVVGNPVSDEKAGRLTPDDLVDPDYFETYYIDYFSLDLTGLEPGGAVLVRLTPATDAQGNFVFQPFVALYDKNARDPENGGGLITAGGTEFVFKVEEGIEYLVGVSTFGVEEAGSYTLTTSNGALTAFRLE